MSKQNIFIIGFNLLYEILDEIKENLSFKIEKFENEEEFIKNPNLDTVNSLIISKDKLKLTVNKNFLSFDHFPISVNKLQEIINIQLIKLKFKPFFPIQHFILKSSIIRVFLFFT